MKIKKYNPEETRIMRFVKSDAEIRLSAQGSGSKGTEENPYIIGEYISLYLSGEWEGGYVEGVGYVGKEQNSIDFHASEDWDRYFSNVFSFLNTSVIFPSGISLPKETGSSKSDEQGYDYNQRTISYSFVIDGVFFDLRVCIINCIAIVATTATSSKELHDEDYCLSGNGWSVDLTSCSYTSDGGRFKYTFYSVAIPYKDNETVKLYSKKSGESFIL